MIDEEKLEKLLEDNYGSLYAELQFMPVDEFIAKNKEELKAVPGFLDLYNSSANAPHGLTEEQIDSYFDKESDKENYRKSEAEYNKTLAEKTKEAEGYDPDKARRKKLVDEYQHSYWGMDTSNPVNKGLNLIADAVISPGTKQAIIEDEPKSNIVARGISDVAAAGADALPGVGGLVVGPTIRGVNRLTNDDKSTALADIGLDYGGNVILNEGIRGLAGVQDLGPIGKWLERLPLNEWAEVVKNTKLGKFVMDKMDPNMAKQMNDLPIARRNAVVDNAASKKAAGESTTEAIEHALAEDNKQQVAKRTKERFTTEANKEWIKEHPIKAGVGVFGTGGSKTIEKGGARAGNKYLRSEDDPKEKSYNSALDYIIKENERMWKAGFRPHGGIELEAWKKWKGIK